MGEVILSDEATFSDEETHDEPRLRFTAEAEESNPIEVSSDFILMWLNISDNYNCI